MATDSSPNESSRHEKPPAAPARTWHCGTLIYSRAGLAALFVFLLWGDFCFALMQVVIPSVLPLKLKALGASNFLIGLLLTSTFSIIGLFLSPYLSFKSDYMRSKWGRRIPFLAASLPLLCLSIILLAFSEDIARLLNQSNLTGPFGLTAVTICIVSACIVSFQFCDVMVVSIFNYIFNDTVPTTLLGRFTGLMKVISGMVSFLYNYFVFQYAGTHMREIFIGTAILYFTGIGLICLFIKEGEYPPVSESERRQSRGIEGVKTFFRESFSHRFYWTKYLFAATNAFTIWAVVPFYIFFYQEMGMSLDYVGKAAAIASVAFMISAYFSAIFVDRWHPLRILTYSTIFSVIFAFSNWVWLFVTLPPKAFFWFYMLGTGIIGAFYGTLSSVSNLPCDMRLLPKSRFGQFSSAQSILANGFRVAGGLCAGIFFDCLKWFFPGSTYAYRFIFAWSVIWLVAASVVAAVLYRQWRSLGGDAHFHPPAPWLANGYEEMENPPFVDVQSSWLLRGLVLIRIIMGISIAYAILLTFWLWKTNWRIEVTLLSALCIPLSILLYVILKRIDISIVTDLKRCRAGLQTSDGIPHHGVLVATAVALLLLLLVWIGQTVVAIQQRDPTGILVFAAGNLLTNWLVVAAVTVLRRLERGFNPMLDHDGYKNAGT